MGEYLKIKDFADRLGISRQAVYQRIKRDLAPYTQKSGRETLIDADAAALFDGSQLLDKVDKTLTAQPDDVVKLLDSFNDQICTKDKQIDALQAQIVQLLQVNQEQFANLTSQIDNLTGQLDKLREQNQYQSEHIMQQSDRLSVLLSQQQYLTHAIAEPDAEQSDISISDTQPAKPKFWQRWFKG